MWDDRAKIVPVRELIELKMTIPIYQRPYRWLSSTAQLLFNDIIEACEDSVEKYRIGSVILHRDKDKLGLVDGQQRMTTLTLLLNELGYEQKKMGLMDANYKRDSITAISQNRDLFIRKIKELENSNGEYYKEKIRNYILNNCELVCIITTSEQEAFQFFDSQNTRGKELEPHDLLKAYHLRDISDDNEKEIDIKEIVVKWESLNSDELKGLFKDYLYPLKQWLKKRNGLGYDSNKIQLFKGFKKNSNYSYAKYHKLRQMSEVKFLLTNPIISGEEFFGFVEYYKYLLDEIDIKVNEIYQENVEILFPSKISGDTYIKRLFKSSLLLVADRFGLDTINKGITDIMYTWAYSLRLVMHAVYEASINNYAIGNHGRINEIPMFEYISEAMTPNELEILSFNRILKSDTSGGTGVKDKYSKIADYLRHLNGDDFIES